VDELRAAIMVGSFRFGITHGPTRVSGRMQCPTSLIVQFEVPSPEFPSGQRRWYNRVK
jgi:hypothetical protein